jgi:hypothetical protein
MRGFVGEYGKNIEDFKRAGISPLARGREHPDPVVVNTPKHPLRVVRATGIGASEVNGRKSGRDAWAAARGEKALEEGSGWSFVARKGRRTIRTWNGSTEVSRERRSMGSGKRMKRCLETAKSRGETAVTGRTPGA